MAQDVSTLCSSVWKETHHWKTLNPTHITISSEEKKGSIFELAAGRGWAPALPLLTYFFCGE
jgi:hypothetical protein